MTNRLTHNGDLQKEYVQVKPDHCVAHGVGHGSDRIGQFPPEGKGTGPNIEAGVTEDKRL